MAEKLILSIADYAIVAVILLISACIGLYFRFSGKDQKTNEDYLLAGRDMSVLPVAFSLMATFMSATTLMGIPAEMYLFGTHMAFMNVGFVLGGILSAWLFVPVYFDTGVCTAYEYLEKRFGKTIRQILSACFIFQYLLFTAVSLYAPALALSAVTNLPLWIAIVSVGIVCTFYCTLGGMKAVLWTDVFQAILMYACLLVIIVKGSLDLGGFTNIFDIAYDGGRMVVPSLTITGNERYTLLSVLLQGTIITLGCFGCTQGQVQRMLTIKDIKRSKIATYASIPMICVFQLACCVCGLVFYGVFRFCDPLTSPDKPIQSADQLMPLYITTALKEYPGLPGLCIAGIFSASLSTASSAINSMAAVLVEDFIRPLRPQYADSLILTRILTFIFGGLCILLSFLGGALGNLVKTTILIVAVFHGPTLAAYLLASLSVIANEKGSIVGLLFGASVSTYLSVTSSQAVHQILPLSKDCEFQNQSFISLTSSFVSTNDTSKELHFTNSTSFTTLSPEDIVTNTEMEFHLSYMWVTPIALVTSLVTGYISSLIFRFFQEKPQNVPVIYLCPVRRWFCKEETESKKVINSKLEQNEQYEFQESRCNTKSS